MRLRLFAAALLLCASPGGATPALGTDASATARGAGAVAKAPAPDGIDRLVAAIQQAVSAGDADALNALAAGNISREDYSEFVSLMTSPRPTVATVKERDRLPMGSVRQRVILEILTDHEREGRVSTWRLDVAPLHFGDPDTQWVIAEIEKLTVISGLYRLTLDTTREFTVHNLAIQFPDLTLTLPSGHAFVAESHEGPTSLVLLGKGRVVFSPKPAAEKGQIRIFCGQETLADETQALFIRVNPSEFNSRVAAGSLVQRTPDASHVRHAQQLFDLHAPQSFQINLGDLSPERWSLVPTGADAVVEITTRHYGVLTYARSSSEPEDISLFDRRRKKNISVYASEERVASRGPFYSEDDLADYDVVHYDLRTTFSPDRFWIDGTARLTIRTRAPALTTMSIRLAEPLVLRSVYSPQFGRLLQLRVVGQNSVLIGLPATAPAGTQFDIDFVYGGRLEPQALDREAVQVQRDQPPDQMVIEPEPQFIYSNRAFWYPQGMVTDYATANITIVVPQDLDIVASGAPTGPPTVVPSTAGQRARKQYDFVADRPVRYLGFVGSRFQGLQVAGLDISTADRPFNLFVQANPRQSGRSRGMADKASDILKFYASILGDEPYESFTLALTESDLPGGHSPAYFAIVNQPMSITPYTWSNDPVAFQNYPSFFLAHEIAHQWWGQAIGWKNYHEQWISEGFAQYFAALYADHERGADQFTSVLRQMRKTAAETSSQGPVYLGYRLGHIKSDSRVFRALVYNKGALVLHMLRRLIGDEAFFSGLRALYSKWRYSKAGTEDVRAAMEAASGRHLQRFFTQWIYESGVPVVRFTSRAEGSELHVRFEQKGDLYELPITVTMNYADGTSEDVIVLVNDKVAERTLPLRHPLRSVEANRDGGALVEIEK